MGEAWSERRSSKPGPTSCHVFPSYKERARRLKCAAPEIQNRPVPWASPHPYRAHEGGDGRTRHCTVRKRGLQAWTQFVSHVLPSFGEPPGTRGVARRGAYATEPTHTMGRAPSIQRSRRGDGRRARPVRCPGSHAPQLFAPTDFGTWLNVRERGRVHTPGGGVRHGDAESGAVLRHGAEERRGRVTERGVREGEWWCTSSGQRVFICTEILGFIQYSWFIQARQGSVLSLFLKS